MLFEKIKLEEDEKILKMVRKHWFVILVELIGVLMLLFIPFLLLLFFIKLPSYEIYQNLNLNLVGQAWIITLLISSWSLIVVMGAFSVWTHYYLDLWIITDRRIIAIDQINFFHRNVSIFRLERLQDIEFNISGIIPTLLNFGALKAQTAGAHESNFKTTGLPDPRGLQAVIQRATDARLKVLEGNASSTID